jgi:HSP20 family molecular chaperone IbpA
LTAINVAHTSFAYGHPHPNGKVIDGTKEIVMNEEITFIDFANSAPIIPPRSDKMHLSISVIENDAFYEIRSALPGVVADDVCVGISDDVLTIGAKASAQSEHICGRFFTIDHRVALVEQSFALPSDVDITDLTTTFQDGILSIFLARKATSNIIPLFRC